MIQYLKDHNIKHSHNEKLIIEDSLCLHEPHNFLKNMILKGDLYYLTSKDISLENSCIEGNLYLFTIKKIPDNFDTIKVSKSIYLNSLEQINIRINNRFIDGDLVLKGLQNTPKYFLENSIINGDVYLDKLEFINEGFLFNTKISGNLYLNSIENIELNNSFINGEILLKNKTIKNKLPNKLIDDVLFIDDKLFKIKNTTVNNDYVTYEDVNGIIIKQKQGLDVYSFNDIDDAIVQYYNQYKIYNTYDLWCFLDVPKYLFEQSIIEGNILMNQIKDIPKNFLKNKTIKGDVRFMMLKDLQEGFLYNSIIEGNLSLDRVQYLPKGFFNNITIKGSIHLESLLNVYDGFLDNTIIYGNLYLNSLKCLPNNFLVNTTIMGSLHLNNVKELPNDFLQNTIIKDSLFLRSIDTPIKVNIGGNLFLKR